MRLRYWISENIILHLSDMVQGYEVHKYYKFFRQSVKWSQKEIKELQLKKLKKIIAHAYNNVPFYQQRFKENNIYPNKIKTLYDLQLIPPLSRLDIQQNSNALLSKMHQRKKLYKGSSSGSTGVPVFYYKDSKAISAERAAGFLGWSMSGWKLGMKGLHIWGNPTTVNNEWKRPGSKIKAFAFNHHKFAAYKLTDEKEFGTLAKLLLSKNYDFIDGYTNAIYLLSEYLKENNISLRKKLKMVLTTAENLQDFQRESINEFLGPVFDNYGCSEINGIANECKKCGEYHIIDPHVYVEFGKVFDEHEDRELIITDLDNYAFPLIRYKNDDVGIKIYENEIGCNIKYSRMHKVSGRQLDIIKLPEGGTLSVPSFFGSMLLKKIKGIKHYQIIREEMDLLTILLVKSAEFSETDLNVINAALYDYLNNKINYRIIFVDKINVSQTGKFKLLIDKTL